AHLIEEPLAAAIGAGLPVDEAVGSLVLDVGGGTSELAVTALGGIVVSGSLQVGGYDLDEAIVRVLQQQHKLLVGQEQAEQVKIEIGSALDGANEPGTAEIAGRDLVTGLLRRLTVTASDVHRALERPLNQIVDALKDLLERTPAELSADIAGRGVSDYEVSVLLEGCSGMGNGGSSAHPRDGVGAAHGPLRRVHVSVLADEGGTRDIPDGGASLGEAGWEHE